jgi:hypothetical protein
MVLDGGLARRQRPFKGEQIKQSLHYHTWALVGPLVRTARNTTECPAAAIEVLSSRLRLTGHILG